MNCSQNTIAATLLVLLASCVTTSTGSPAQPEPSAGTAQSTSVVSGGGGLELGGFGGQELDNCEVNVFPTDLPIATVQAVIAAPAATTTFRVRVQDGVHLVLGGPVAPGTPKWADLDDWSKEYRVVFSDLDQTTARVTVNAFDIATGNSTTVYGPANVVTIGYFDTSLSQDAQNPVSVTNIAKYNNKNAIRVRFDTYGKTVSFTLAGSF